MKGILIGLILGLLLIGIVSAEPDLDYKRINKDIKEIKWGEIFCPKEHYATSCKFELSITKGKDTIKRWIYIERFEITKTIGKDGLTKYTKRLATEKELEAKRDKAIEQIVNPPIVVNKPITYQSKSKTGSIDVVIRRILNLW